MQMKKRILFHGEAETLKKNGQKTDTVQIHLYPIWFLVHAQDMSPERHRNAKNVFLHSLVKYVLVE